MNERLRENYFPVLKLVVVFGLEFYIVTRREVLTGDAGPALLLLTFFIAAVTGYEILEGWNRWIFLSVEWVIVLLLAICIDKHLLLLVSITIMDTLAISALKARLHPVCCLLAVGPVFLLPGGESGNYLLVVVLVVAICLLERFIMASYRSQLKLDRLQEEQLKISLGKSEVKLFETIRKNRLESEKRLLEEKAEMSQRLHDKVGRSMNGSVYQLEACKLLLDEDTDKTRERLQVVIDNLRISMDEIRAILRQERPDKDILSQLQLQGLCEDCKDNYGIDAKFSIEGNGSEIPDSIWEIILDNTFESVSNALKYAKCSKIRILVVVLNKMVRCSVADNGVGAESITDGMGIAGMRNRVRNINGILDFETEAGFKINMLLPYPGTEDVPTGKAAQ